jgi:hypothetical protein
LTRGLFYDSIRHWIQEQEGTLTISLKINKQKTITKTTKGREQTMDVQAGLYGELVRPLDAVIGELENIANPTYGEKTRLADLRLLQLTEEKRQLLVRLVELLLGKLPYEKGSAEYNDLAVILSGINSANCSEQLATAQSCIDHIWAGR